MLVTFSRSRRAERLAVSAARRPIAAVDRFPLFTHTLHLLSVFSSFVISLAKQLVRAGPKVFSSQRFHDERVAKAGIRGLSSLFALTMHASLLTRDAFVVDVEASMNR